MEATELPCATHLNGPQTVPWKLDLRRVIDHAGTLPPVGRKHAFGAFDVAGLAMRIGARVGDAVGRDQGHVVGLDVERVPPKNQVRPVKARFYVHAFGSLAVGSFQMPQLRGGNRQQHLLLLDGHQTEGHLFLFSAVPAVLGIEKDDKLPNPVHVVKLEDVFRFLLIRSEYHENNVRLDAPGVQRDGPQFVEHQARELLV